jgi:hypothetical protein
MKVTRGRSFQNEAGSWEKLEVELTTDDLLTEEISIEKHLHPLMLEIRADQQIVSFSHRLGNISEAQAKAESEKLKVARKRVLAMSQTNLPSRLSR